ncbi:MAG: DUF4062 domain-containing protein [Myxococcaceae bacterium]|nr:MAG: DUF4062 domain-containing protein [Myxococcaceae bacterium]
MSRIEKTMLEKRYQVFVSSTFADLEVARQQVMHALLELGCFPAGMELFPASNESQWELIRRVIDDSDYYVLVLAGRYGSTDASGVGYTEMEYDYARSKGIPVLSFVHSDPESIPSRHSEKTDEGRRRLDLFRKKVLSDKMCKHWKDAGDLGGKVSASVVHALKVSPREGWLRASIVHDPFAALAHRSFQSGDIDWDDYFSSASTLQMMFIGSPTWRSHHFVRIRDFCERGGTSIKVLLPDPAEKVVRRRMATWQGLTESKAVARITEAINDFASLANSYSSCSIEVIGMDDLPYFSFFRFDQRGLVAFYSHLRKRAAVPTLACRSGDIVFDYAVSELEELEMRARRENRLFFPKRPNP